MPEHLQVAETAGEEEGNRGGKNKSKGKAQNAKGKAGEMNEQCGNVFENKGPSLNAELGTVDYELRKVGSIS